MPHVRGALKPSEADGNGKQYPLDAVTIDTSEGAAEASLLRSQTLVGLGIGA
jgi:hypothetical protein